MFRHRKNAIAICVTAACLIGSVTAHAQTQSNNSELSRRMAALQQARQRTETTVVTSAPEQVAQSIPRISRASSTVHPPGIRTAQAGSGSRIIAPGSGSRVVAQGSGSQFVAPGSGSQLGAPTGGFVPGHLQGGQIINGPIIDGGSPIVQGGIIDGGFSNGQIIEQSPFIDGQVIGGPIGSSISGGEVIVDQPYGEVIGDSYSTTIDGSCGDGSCGCGEVGDSYFAGDCCGRGGCGIIGGPCFVDRFRKVIRQAEFFGGFTSFRSNLFTALDGSNDLVDDSSHGTYGGLNLGLPLCPLTGGLFSGQFGVRTVNTNFGGAEFTDDDRNQFFITAGFFRRVDQGLQLGVVADIIREEWFSEADLVQIRGEIGYVWQSGTSFGFRFANNAQDDVTTGEFNGVEFTDSIVRTVDWYRFFIRHEAARGGYGEIFAGWSESDQGIIGLDFDLPITNRIAIESGFTYYLGDEPLPTNQGFIGGDQFDAFNVFVGLSLRPSGRQHYRNYDRPLFDVADNGTATITRQ